GLCLRARGRLALAVEQPQAREQPEQARIARVRERVGALRGAQREQELGARRAGVVPAAGETPEVASIVPQRALEQLLAERAPELALAGRELCLELRQLRARREPLAV